MSDETQLENDKDDSDAEIVETNSADEKVDTEHNEPQVDEEIAVEIDSANGDDVFDETGIQLEEAEHVDIETLKPILEGAILAAGESLTLVRMQTLFEEGQIPSKDHLREALELIQQDCEHRGFELCEVASGWRFQVRNTYAPWVNRLWDEKPQKYSRALLETLALIAYRQPITRGDIEDVRGVAVSSHIIKTLAERDWVKVVGHRDVPGRPALYATTKQFLDYFNLKSMDELPTLGELKDIDGLNQNLEFESALEKLSDDADIVAHPEKDPDLEVDGVDLNERLLDEAVDEEIGGSLEKTEDEHHTDNSLSDISDDQDTPELDENELSPEQQNQDHTKVGSE